MEANMNDKTAETNPARIGAFRPKLAFYHPNGKGTGCAVNMTLHPAHDDVAGSIMLSVANQNVIGDRRGPKPTFARFDWENSIKVKLDFSDLCKILQVLRGECESIDDGRGLYHQSVKATTRIAFRHLTEPVHGYAMEFYRVPVGGENETRAYVLFNASEALGLCEAISGAMCFIGFGIPMLVPHDTSAYVAARKEMGR